MNEDNLRAAMRKRFEAMSMSEWCRLTGVHKGHLSEFMNGYRAPCNDLLRALNMRVDYVRNKAQGTEAHRAKTEGLGPKDESAVAESHAP